jgi:nucleotide-binding universal stress UspA family protein
MLAQAALADARSTAAQGAQHVRAEFPSWKVEPETACDYSPYRALVQKADKWRPDLLVVGSHGRSAAGRALLGSVSQKVLSHAICSVRVARFREDAGRLAGDPIRLVVGIDGSSDSAAAVSAVADRAWPAGSEATVVMAVDPHLTMALAYGPQYGALAMVPVGEGTDTERARRITESVARELKRSGLSAVPIVQEGDPKRILLQEAERCNADCIFVGAKGHSRLERFLLGSVSSAVAARARCSVEVVRQG